MGTPHDSLFRDTFGKAEHAGPLLRALLPPVLAAAIDWDSLEPLAAQQFLAPVGDDDDAAANAIAEWADVVRRLLLAPTGQAAFETLSSYILKTTRLGRERLVVLFEQHIGAGSMKKKFVSTWDRIKREGVVQGKAEGKLEGKLEGRIEGATTVLLQLLRRRFGELPDAVTARVTGGSQAELDRWVDRVLDAATLDDVFAR